MKPTIDPKELEDIRHSYMSTVPDYTKIVNGSDLLEVLGDDGLKWAAAFCQITKKRFDIDLEMMYVQGWFANAIEYSGDLRRWRKEAAEKAASTDIAAA